MTTVYVRGEVIRTGRAGKAGDPIGFVATTEGLKADGLNLMMDKLDLERFEANPVIGYGHNFYGRNNLPIGRAVDIEIDPPALRLSVAFDQADEFATTVEQKVRDRFLNAMSVGFDVQGVDNDTGIPKSWELFESSIVPIPLDPDALSEVGRAAVKDLEAMLTKAREAFPADDDDSNRRDEATTTEDDNAREIGLMETPDKLIYAGAEEGETRIAMARRRLRLLG